MPSRPYWFSVAVRKLPDEFTDGIVIAEGLEEDASLKPDRLHYAILGRTLADSEAEALKLINEAAKELEPLASNMIADDARLVVRQERRVAASLQSGEVLLKASFVGFKSDSPEARTSAMEIVRLAIERSWWQFWR